MLPEYQMMPAGPSSHSTEAEAPVEAPLVSCERLSEAMQRVRLVCALCSSPLTVREFGH